MKRIMTLIGSIFFALQFRLYADIAVYEPSVSEKMVIDSINIKIFLIPFILLGIALILLYCLLRLLCCLLRYLRSKKRERDKAGSAEKTEKKKKLLSTECIVCIVIVILLYVAGVVALVMFPKSVSTFMKEARIVFQGSCKICGYKNDGKKSVSHECYYCKKCAKFHDLSKYRDIDGARWCKNCCRSVAAGVELRFAHCCSCGGQHYPGKCTRGDSSGPDWLQQNVSNAQ